MYKDCVIGAAYRRSDNELTEAERKRIVMQRFIVKQERSHHPVHRSVSGGRYLELLLEELRIGNGIVKPAGIDLGQVEIHLVAIFIFPVTGQGFDFHVTQVPGNLGADTPGLRFIVGRDVPVRVPDVRKHRAAGKSDIRVVRQRRAHVGGGAAAGLVVRVIAEHTDTYCVSRPEQQLGTEGLYVGGVFVFTGKTIIRIAVIVMKQAGNAHRGAFTDGDIQRAFHPDGGVIAAADVQVATRFILRFSAQ